MMTIAAKEISNELMSAYKDGKLVSIQIPDETITGGVAAVNDDQAFIKRPAKGVMVIRLDDIRKVTVLN
ncbi:hypothetical protein KTE19_12540 [Lentilactobacillus sp. IMAU92037]|uniref:hypothetical protein n=1 Tax=Lentilactobacillus TaxID=2767893 RepID=UPI001C259F93|nr:MULTISPECIES: hypothetical protein [Lentilactobacillus]MBU9790310.1 hypothetical protein [Lentilactobacillus dabitei]MBV0931508.1 hypothetical protein [Lentilactobacillus dabitei]MDM7517712.1 hypothetical protein [Lentilactobacillus sp. TOM.63]